MTVLKTNGAFMILAKNPKRLPLRAYTPDSMPPLDVSSTARVDNLNADLLDGMDCALRTPAGGNDVNSPSRSPVPPQQSSSNTARRP
jgi:hypothetical protein